MMSLPFLGLFAALIFVSVGHRRLAILCWLTSMVILLVLFRGHAADTLRMIL
ncbi:DUF5993 family protein [Ancylobacter sp. SL191]|jgi:hypothetical protein|uniref:DUF5993 family protein n=1 Tax=Ancylobacter sp. SL191 TaxID=2995166 RepID=UPI0022707E8F|nr:DUF5993 family protein [Ancylobacter sp. SL191]WAC28722.1 DUF5993 family protein [Ancylobacter sp. SL191]